MACNEICLRYKAKRSEDGRRYSDGQKRCQKCEIFINWEGPICPCCNFKLRTVPRGSKWRRVYTEIKTN